MFSRKSNQTGRRVSMIDVSIFFLAYVGIFLIILAPEIAGVTFTSGSITAIR